MRIPSEARISRRVFCQGPHFGLASSRHQQGSRGNSKAITSAKPSQAALRKNASVIVISDSDSDDHVSEVDTGPGGGKSTDKVRAQGKGKQKESNSSETVSECYSDIWSEHFFPDDLDELAVHKKKVADVRGWLTEALDNPKLAKYRRMLVLSGPAGAGKTATIRLLCREMGVEVMEFRSGSDGGADSLTTQFNAFLSSSAQRPSLAFGETSKPGSSSASNNSATSDCKRLVLVEDLPNIFTSQHTRDTFRAALSDFVFRSFNNRSTQVPIVLIVSETVVRSGRDESWQGATSWPSRQDEGVSVRTLVPLDVLKGGRCTEIRFNPVALTIQVKGLKRILQRAQEATQRHGRSPLHKPTDDVVKLIAQSSNGDLRSAINTMQFLAQRTDKTSVAYDSLHHSSAAQSKKRKRGTKQNGPNTTQNDAIATLVTGRETSLFLFHALGRVLYSKRWGDSLEDDAKDNRPKPPDTRPLPAHLEDVFARKPSKVDANDLFADAPVDTELFTAYLHQNYTSYMRDVDQCGDALEYLSIADSLLRLEGDTFSKHPAASQYSFQTSVRGMLMSLPSPVPRRNQKMYKADLWDRTRKMRENELAVATLVLAFAKTHRPLQPPSNRESATRENEEIDDKTQLSTTRVVGQEIVPFLKLLEPASYGGDLPVFATNLIKELSQLEALENVGHVSGILGEHDMDQDDEEGQAATSAPSVDAGVTDEVVEAAELQEDKGEWFLDEDDIQQDSD